MKDRVYVSLLRIITQLFTNLSKRKVREVLVR